MNANESTTLHLPAGQVLTITAPSGSAGSVVRLPLMPGGGDAQSVTAIAGANLTFGPYAQPERFQVNCTAGTVTPSMAVHDPSLSATDIELAAILAASITNGDTTHAPDGNSVFDALALKAPLASPSFTGAVVIGGTIQIPEKTPVNAVAASKLLTIGTNPIEGATVSIGGVTYKFRADALGAGVAASKVLTSDNIEVTDGDTVTIGTTVYRFKDTMTQAYDVKRHGTVADTTMENLIKAINATGTAGVEYFAGTLIHPDVSAGALALAAHAFTATAKAVGFAGNSIAIAEASTHLSWAGGAVALSGGIDPQAANDVLIGGNIEGSIDNLVLAITDGGVEGTNYGTGTVTNPLATAVKASAATMTATNKVKGEIGNATAIAETLADGSWAAAATFLTGGVDGTVGLANELCADGSYIYHAIAANTIADANWRRVALGSAY